MSDFINLKSEIYFGDQYFKNHVMPPDFDYRAHKKELSPYFAKYGFKVSMMYSDFFSRFSGIQSDRYPSMDLVYMYMMPCLCRHDFMWAYVDKNLFSVYFRDVNQPETVIKCWNGIYYDDEGRQIDRSTAEMLALREKKCCIIKPTVQTSNGNGVARFENQSLESIQETFRRYGSNFIVQRQLVQHSELARLNASSFNTYRILTYRDFDKRVHFLKDISHLRIGGKGSARDNLSSGGVACHIRSDGMLVDECTRYKSMQVFSMKQEYGVENFCVPYFSDAVDLAVSLHARLPYFDFIGWDIGICADGRPVFIEYNVVPGVEGPQMIGGPLFGEYEDEVMDRVRRVQHQEVSFSRRSWPNGFDHFLQTAGPNVGNDELIR